MWPSGKSMKMDEIWVLCDKWCTTGGKTGNNLASIVENLGGFWGETCKMFVYCGEGKDLLRRIECYVQERGMV